MPGVKSLLHLGYTQKTKNMLNTNMFLTNGIQEVSGSIPLISTKKVPEMHQKRWFPEFFFSFCFAAFSNVFFYYTLGYTLFVMDFDHYYKWSVIRFKESMSVCV